MIARVLATGVIALLLVLDLALPFTPIGRRGIEDRVRLDVAAVADQVGRPFPLIRLETLDGTVVSTDDLRGHRVLLVFERSVDW